MATSTINAQGVSPILPTPFNDNGAVDILSLRRLIEYQMTLGVTGVSILGFMGENAKLSDGERELITRTVVEQAAGEIDVWVGVRALGTMGAVEAAQRAEAAGANAVFVAPIRIQNDEVLFEHYRSVHEAIGITQMIHDLPQFFGVQLSAELIARLGRAGITPYIKLEEVPSGLKLTQVRELSADSIKVFSGLGGLYLIEELERGAIGIMSGFSFSDMLVRICNEYASGQHERAAETFNQIAGLLRYEFQPGIGVALRKHFYHRRGIFSSPYVRRPVGRTLSAYDIMEYERVIQRAGLSIELTK